MNGPSPVDDVTTPLSSADPIAAAVRTLPGSPADWIAADAAGIEMARDELRRLARRSLPVFSAQVGLVRLE